MTVPLLPPVMLMQETEVPLMTGDTNGALLDYALALKAALGEANAKAEGLRVWARETQ